MDNKIERKCVLCKKKIKRFSKWNDNKNRSVHRKCWLDFRTFGDRYADFLFCGDRKEQNKVIKVKPIDKDIDVIDIGGNEVPIS